MADFAKTQLLKYGWTEGKGLGKAEDGIVEAIKPKFKFDNTGVGHKSDICNNWWESVFNKASQNVSVDKSSSGVSLKVLDETAPIFSNKQDLKTIQKEHNSKYKTFLKTSTLENGKLVQKEVEDVPKEVEIGVLNLSITDDELFKACGGRTAHKGARHGLKLSGKLTRIAQQEEEMLAAVKKEWKQKGEKKVRTKKKSAERTDSTDKKKEKKEEKRKRKAVDTESEEDIIDEDNKDISHLLNTTKNKVELTKTQRRSGKKKINNLVQMLDKSCTLEESLVNKSEKGDTKRKKKKKKTSDSGSEDAASEFSISKTEKKMIQLGQEMYKIIKDSQKKQLAKPEEEDYLETFKDITFKRYEEQDPEKFSSQKKPGKSKYIEEQKKIDRLSKKLGSLCSLEERRSKRKKSAKGKKPRHLSIDQDISTIDANKLNSRIQKKKRKRLMKEKCKETVRFEICNKKKIKTYF